MTRPNPGLRHRIAAAPLTRSLRWLVLASLLGSGAAWAAPVTAPLAIKREPAPALTALPATLDAPANTASAAAPVAPAVVQRLDAALPAATAVVPQEASPAPVSLSRRTLAVMQSALSLLGTPYRWGGTDPDSGLDCSGLVGYVFRSTLGLDLPRISRDLARAGQPILARAELNPGDLVFFGLRGRVSHVGIYLGDGRFLHAPRRGEDVRIDDFNSRYWQARFLGARRVGL